MATARFGPRRPTDFFLFRLYVLWFFSNCKSRKGFRILINICRLFRSLRVASVPSFWTQSTFSGSLCSSVLTTRCAPIEVSVSRLIYTRAVFCTVYIIHGCIPTTSLHSHFWSEYSVYDLSLKWIDVIFYLLG